MKRHLVTNKYRYVNIYRCMQDNTFTIQFIGKRTYTAVHIQGTFTHIDLQESIKTLLM